MAGPSLSAHIPPAAELTPPEPPSPAGSDIRGNSGPLRTLHSGNLGGHQPHKFRTQICESQNRQMGSTFGGVICYLGGSLIGTLFDLIGLSKPNKLARSAPVPGPGGLMCLSHVGGDRPRHPMSLASRHRSLVRKSRWSAE